MPGGVRLGVGYGSVETVAVLSWPRGGWRVLLFDGVPRLPSAVHVSEGGLVAGVAALNRGVVDPGGLEAEPGRRLTEGIVGLGAGAVEVVDLVAATFRRVAAEAEAVVGGPVGEVVVVVPAGWGPRRRTVLRRAVHRAGLAEPVLVEAPVATAWRLLAVGVDIPVGAWLGVCDAGAGFEASVVRRTGGGFEVLATVAADAGGRRLEAALAGQVLRTAGALSETGTPSAAGAPPVANPGPGGPLPDGHVDGGLTAGEWVALLGAVRAAKETLAMSAGVAVPLPAPWPAVVVTAAELRALTGPIVEMAGEVLRQATMAAEVTGQDCAGVFAVGGSARVPAVVEGLTAALQSLGADWRWPPVVPVRVLAEPQLAAVLGAVAATGAAGEGSPDPVEAADVQVPPLRRAAGLAVAGFGSLALWAHFLVVAQVNRYAVDARLDYVIAPWGELAAAGLFVVVGCLSAGTVLAAVLPPAADPGPAGEPTDTGTAGGVPVGVVAARRVSGGLLAAVGLGLTIATGYALVAAIGFGLATGGFLRWALLPAVPVTVVAVVAALLAWRARRSPPGGWHAWLTFPPLSLLLAGAGMLAVSKGLYAPGTVGPVVNAVMVHAGAALLGVGAAFALATGARLRVILSGPFAALAAALVIPSTLGLLTVGYAVAAAAWWGRRVWQLTGTGALRPPGTPL